MIPDKTHHSGMCELSFDASAKVNANIRTFEMDAATLIAAKASLVSLDLASDLARQQARGDKEMRSESWAF